MKIMKRILSVILAVFIGTITVLSNRSSRGITAYTQPDGTVVNVSVIGDEFGYMIFSDDNRLLVNVEGRLEYAKFGEDGVPCASGIPVGCKKVDEKKILDIQTSDQIDTWADMLAKKKSEKIQERYKLKQDKSNVLCLTRNNDLVEDEETISFTYGKIHDLIPLSGEQRLLVILVEYQDVSLKDGSFDYLQRMLNEEGFSDYGASGSVRDLLIQNSNGIYSPKFDFYGPVKLPEKRKFYGADTMTEIDVNAHMMAVHALLALDEEVDFSIYDGNGDGKIDNVFIIYAGYGENDVYDSNAIWPQMAFMSENTDETFKFDGVELNMFACCNEYSGIHNRLEGMGVFVHEFSHVLGLPDIYDQLFAFTPGNWSVIDVGDNNNDGLTPPNYSCYERGVLGWIEFRKFHEGEMEIPALADSNIAYAMPTENETEIYLFENRQQTGFDTYLPGHGMVVWHIDYDDDAWKRCIINYYENHQRVDLVEADNKRNGESRDGDSFPGADNITQFGLYTTPSLRSWKNKKLDFDLYDIEETPDGIIRFKTVKSGENPNSVDNLSQDSPVEDCINKTYYDIMGRRVVNPEHGLYIVNGKKILLN